MAAGCVAVAEQWLSLMGFRPMFVRLVMLRTLLVYGERGFLWQNPVRRIPVLGLQPSDDPVVVLSWASNACNGVDPFVQRFD